MGARPDDHSPALRGDDLILALLCTAAGPLLWWFGTSALAGAPSGGGIQFVERSVAALCAGTGAIIAACWLVAVLGATLEACGHRWRSARLARLGRALSPAFLRRLAASALGVNILLVPGAWAAVGPDHGLGHPGPVAAPSVVLAADRSEVPHAGWLPPSTARSAADPGLPTPTWQPETPAPATPGSTRTAQPAAEEATTISVRHGDCLWDIAAHELGPAATDLEVDRRWRQWYQHNRSLIGTEADLLLPGTVLTAPPFD